MIIIVEGIDRVGKTTLCNRLRQEIGYPVFKHNKSEFSYDQMDTSNETDKMIQMLEVAHSCNGNIIFDRFHLSECIYGTKLRDYNKEEAFKNCIKIDKYLASIGACLIYVSPTNIKRSSFEHGSDLTDYNHLFHQFYNLTRIKNKINVNFHTLDQAIGYVQTLISGQPKSKRISSVGYSFWGYLSDKKTDKDGNEISTPDGNAIYSWSILNVFQLNNIDTYRIMPDRDYVKTYSWAKDIRTSVCDNFNNSKMIPIDFFDNTLDLSLQDLTKKLFDYWNSVGLYKLDAILHEWRMKIPGRNLPEDRKTLGKSWQPDLFIQNCLMIYCFTNRIKLVIFDLDYKLSQADIIGFNNIKTIELGTKSEDDPNSTRVYIPFNFKYIHEYPICDKFNTDLVYIGNRYERDWCIDKYIPDDIKCLIYGNWIEGGRDSDKVWPNLVFKHRLQTYQMYEAYSKSVATILLAKKEYCQYKFMTARIIESVFYGSVPLFIEEYGADVIAEYAGKYAEFLTVKSKADVTSKVNQLKSNHELRSQIITYLRNHLKFMDANNFYSRFMNLITD